jgi:hypothetical protein
LHCSPRASIPCVRCPAFRRGIWPSPPTLIGCVAPRNIHRWCDTGHTGARPVRSTQAPQGGPVPVSGRPRPVNPAHFVRGSACGLDCPRCAWLLTPGRRARRSPGECEGCRLTISLWLQASRARPIANVPGVLSRTRAKARFCDRSTVARRLLTPCAVLRSADDRNAIGAPTPPHVVPDSIEALNTSLAMTTPPHVLFNRHSCPPVSASERPGHERGPA